MNIQVISLASAIERRKHIQNEFGKQALNFNFFDALTPNIAVPLAEKMGLNISDEYLSPGELACFMSHVSIWQKMINEDIPYLAIFEDDIILGEHANNFLSSGDWLKRSWGIIKLEKFNDRVLLSNISDKSPDSNRVLKKLCSKHYGCAGYIILLSAAKELISYLNDNKDLIPLDHIVFEKFIYHSTCQILQLNPAICIQDSVYSGSYENFPSDLEETRRHRMRAHKRKGLSKIKYELLRIIDQLRLKIFGCDISFK
ncbi:MAG: glycosyltransferase family 25 protein [Acinetobacter faecalis]|uniref:glycosyltransferase family 25 protein n=1 Tax=Acinetobacter faecalis TaxID=2665161 RepID=UPI002A90A05F|nr:glycosyltransferase family 25 protein [Acinetobacter faecalis]MDY6509616.1 glycosyltransferase family 25 protein [Acinetobacter faecalis]